MFVSIIKGTKKFVQRVFVNKFNTLAVRAVGRRVLYTDISLRGGGGGAELRNSHTVHLCTCTYISLVLTFVYLVLTKYITVPLLLFSAVK